MKELALRQDGDAPADGRDGRLSERLAGLSFRLIQLEQQMSTDGKLRELGRCLAEMRRIQRDLERATRDLRDVSSRQQWLVEEAERSSSRSALILELMPLAVVTVGVDGIVTEANRAAVDLLNRSHRHLLGRSIVLVLGGDRERLLRDLRHMAEGRLDGIRVDLTLRPRERRPVAVRVSAAAQDDQQIVLVFGAAGDSGTTAVAAIAPAATPAAAEPTDLPAGDDQS
jgi:PAS domain S-box-containing protein